MILCLIYLATSRRQKEEIHYNELVKYFQWQPQQDMLYFSDHIHCGTAVKKNDKINVSNVHFYFFLVHYYYLFLSRKIFKQKRKKAPKRPKEVNETNRRTQKNGGRSHHCTLSEP